ncbi:MAG: Eco47II family restriction endonuclease [Patescibacteria group bacterium]
MFNFIDDDKFFLCIEKVKIAYSAVGDIQRNSLDPFKISFDCAMQGITYEQWLKVERVRQADKTVNNALGYFHQMFFGYVDGWRNINDDQGLKQKTGLDLIHDEKKIFCELKSKHNTLNFGGLNELFNKFQKLSNEFPEATFVYAYTICKKKAENKVWIRHGTANERFRVVGGAEVYKLFTGNAMNGVYIIRAVSDALGCLNHIPADVIKQSLGISHTPLIFE